MKDSEIYLMAAISTDVPRLRFSCFQIDAAADPRGSGGTVQRKRYEKLFSPGKNCAFAWGEEWGDNDNVRRNCRVLALLFMHQIALDEERRSKRREA